MRTVWAVAVMALVAFAGREAKLERLAAWRSESPAQELARLERMRAAIRRTLARDTALYRRAAAHDDWLRRRQLPQAARARLGVTDTLRQRRLAAQGELERVEGRIRVLKAQAHAATGGPRQSVPPP